MPPRPVVVITGATNGIGRLAALELARQGVHLGVVARSGAKVDGLRGEIEEIAPGAPVDAFLVDLSSLQDVRQTGQEISARYDRISVLINNAGVHAFSQRITSEGFAEMVAVNYLAPWILTNALRDRLIAAAPSRVVTVASEAGRLHAKTITPSRDITLTDDYTRRESMTLYGRSKLMDVMFTQELARRLAGTGVTANCCSPGFNVTGLGRDLPFAGVLHKILTALRIGDPRRGAQIITRLATDPAFIDTTGGYFSVRDAMPLECPEPGRGADVQRELWDITAELLAAQTSG